MLATHPLQTDIYNCVSDTYHVLEIAHDAIQANAEAGCFEFLCSGRPFHVDATCVADKCFAHVEAEATEEQNELYHG